MPKGDKQPKGVCPDQIKRYRFKKGQSGNPKGRPRTKLLTRKYYELLEKRFPRGVSLNAGFKKVLAELITEGASLATMVAMMQIGQALKGSTAAAAEIADRIEGKPKQVQEIVGPGEGPLQALNIDLEKLSTKELRDLARTLGKAMDDEPEEQDADGGESPDA